MQKFSLKGGAVAVDLRNLMHEKITFYYYELPLEASYLTFLFRLLSAWIVT
jgi:hypothetical protein